MAGLAVPTSQALDIFLQYRFLGTTEINSPALGYLGGKAISNVEAGVRFNF